MKLELDSFLKMLEELDKWISKNRPGQKLIIKSISGFAIMLNCYIRNISYIGNKPRKSRDIDSLSKDFDDEMKNEIMKISKKYDVDDPDGFLNNHRSSNILYFDYVSTTNECIDLPYFAKICSDMYKKSMPRGIVTIRCTFLKVAKHGILRQNKAF